MNDMNDMNEYDMNKIYRCRVIVKGYAEGYALPCTKPINLLTIDGDGIVNDHTSELNGKSIADRVLIYPNAIGSSVGAYRLYALKVNGKAPKAIVCMRADIITASSAAIASIPLVDMVECYDDMLNALTNNNLIRVDAYNGLIQLLT